MVFAVFELAVAQTHPLGHLLGLLLDGLDLFADLLVFPDFFQQKFGFVEMPVKVVDDRLLDRSDNPAFDIGVAELVFRLRFEHGILQFDGDGADDAVAPLFRCTYPARP